MQPATTLTQLSTVPQSVVFSESEGVCSAEVVSTRVLVSSTAGEHNHGSSKVKLRNLVDYSWEHRYYTGQLLAVHMGGKYLAYAMKEANIPMEIITRPETLFATTSEVKVVEAGWKKSYSPDELKEWSKSPLCQKPPSGLVHFPEELVKMDVPDKPNQNSWSGMVRVIHRTTDKRVLLKGMKGEVQDVSFAFIENQIILATIDALGHIYIHNIELVDDNLRGTLVTEVLNDAGPVGARHRVVWCPYIPDEEDAGSEPEEDTARLLLTTHFNTARIWNMWGVVGGLAQGATVVTTSSLLAAGNPSLMSVSEHSAAIVDAAFSPDGTALATASIDGYVMFFQVYMHNETSPRCLHRWQPHDGKPLSCLFFLDNHKNYNSDVQFWKFAVTGAERSSVLKIWCCKSWDCLQTISFASDIGPELASDISSGFKAVLDAGAAYLLLSDFKRRCLYVLHMAQDSDDSLACCRSISEFLLPFPVLSFAVADAGSYTVKCTSSCGDPYHMNGGGGEDGVSPVTFDHADELEEVESSCLNGERGDDAEGCGARALIKLYLLQPKGLQEGRLLFAPPPRNTLPRSPHSPDLADLTLEGESPEPGTEASEPLDSILRQQSQQLKDLLMRAPAQTSNLLGQRVESPPCIPPPPTQLNLMTPDAFSSPGKRDEDTQLISVSPEPSIEPLVPGHILANPSPPAYELEEAPPKYASVGSSPSREVQEILSLKTSAEFFKDETVEVTPEPTLDELQNGSASYDQTALYPADPPPQPKLAAAKETIWPQITIAQINEANQRKASSDKSTSQSINNSLVNAGELSNAADLSTNGDDDGSQGQLLARRMEQLALWNQDARIDAIEHRLNKVIDMLTEQRQMNTDMAVEQRQVVADTRETIGHALHAHTTQTALAIDQAFDERWGRVEMAAASAGAMAGEAATAAVTRALEPFLRSLQHEFATRVSATDKLLRDNIEKMVLSKSIQESLGNAVARTLAGMVRDSFREVIGQTLVPIVEKATAQIFKQVNQVFQAGTKEFAANTEAYARAAAERGGAAALDSLRTALQHHTESISLLVNQPPAAQQLTPVLHSAVRGVLEHEMSRWREQAASVLEMSRSQTPMTPRIAQTPQIVDRQRHQRMSSPQQKCYLHIKHSAQETQYNILQAQVAQVTSLLGAGDVNGAFQVALSASDLSLVVHACRAADPARVFLPTCQLKQHVLLSLVQQLAADMTSDTQIKHRYLEEAIINLDPSSPVTREHLPVVMHELQKQLKSFLAANPAHQLVRSIKMLLMATDTLLSAATPASV